MSIGDAIDYASERDLDLVEVAPGQDVPVCKIMNYGKYKYEKAKRKGEIIYAQKVLRTYYGNSNDTVRICGRL